MTAYETYAGATVATLSLVDQFAQEQGTRGPMPAPIPPQRFSLVARQVQAVMTALVPPIDLIPRSSAAGVSGAQVFGDEGRIGRSPLYRIEPGRYTLRVESDYYQTLETDLDWPPGASELPALMLRPGNAYPFPDLTLKSTRVTLVRGTVMGIGVKAPIANARVEMIDPPELAGAFASCLTDSRGSWVMSFRQTGGAPKQATVRITLPDGGGAFDVPGISVTPNTDNAVSQTALRGWVMTPGGSPIPASEITVDAVPDVSVHTGSDGFWTFYLGLNQPGVQAAVTARTPNGQSAVQNVLIRNRATVVVPSFRIAMN